MRLLIVRHAIAEDKDVWAQTSQDDDARPLTDLGKRKMVRVARGLRKIVGPINLLAASPLVRAQQTAAIVAAEYKGLPIETTSVLVPGKPLAEFAKWLVDRGDSELVAVVGHEPHLSALATWLITGVEKSRIELKKGAACLIQFDGMPKKAGGSLSWSLAPAHLRDLARR
ncbi:MAG TPA: histidine phosphatase family protein [Gemmatimonadaceae bacterium]|nr:histidine phosphatase family protein [Gemmatimonadaceae bacterium]